MCARVCVSVFLCVYVYVHIYVCVSLCVLWRVSSLDCGMTLRSAAAWADALRLCTALREVHFGGTVNVLVTAMWSEFTHRLTQARPWVTMK